MAQQVPAGRPKSCAVVAPMNPPFSDPSGPLLSAVTCRAVCAQATECYAWLGTPDQPGCPGVPRWLTTLGPAPAPTCHFGRK